MPKSWGKDEQSMWRCKEDAGRWKYLHSDLWVVGDKMKFWAERPHEQKKVDLQVHPDDKVWHPGSGKITQQVFTLAWH